MMDKEKTRVGLLLQSIGNIAKPILSAASLATGQPWLNTIAEGIKTSKDLKNEQKEALLNAIQLDLEDVKSARDMNIKIQQSKEASWLSKNITPILAVLIVIATILTYFIEVADGVSQGAVQLCTLVLSFYFGSSIKEKMRIK